MLPKYISKDGERDEAYNRNSDLYFADHYKIFNTDEKNYAINKEDYICFDLLRYAVDTLADGVWLNDPTIEFEDSEVNAIWRKIREVTNFDQQMKKATKMMMYLGDCPIKTIVDENVKTAQEDYKICIYSFSPVNWHPDYNANNVERPATQDSIVTIKELDGNEEALLIETFKPNKIVYTSYISQKDEKNIKQYYQISPRVHFEEELKGVLVDDNTSTSELELEYTTNTEYSLLQTLQGEKKPDCYFGESLFNWSVVSKINAINKYANLSDYTVVNNTIPKLELSAKAGQLLDQAVQEVVQGTYGTNIDQGNEPAPASFDKPVDKVFMTRSSYLRSQIISQVMQKLEVFEGDGRGQTRYITNDFDLGQLRDAQDKLIDSLMAELGIATILYKQEASTGTLSGIAYERLMTITLNKISNIQNLLVNKVKIIAFTVMQLAQNLDYEGLQGKKIEMPKVEFHEAISEDTKENIEQWVLRTQNKFNSVLDAIKDINNVDDETAQKMLAEINGVTPTQSTQSILTEDRAVNANMEGVRNALRERIIQANGGETT